MNLIITLLVGTCLADSLPPPAPPDSMSTINRVGVLAQTGFIIPHSAELIPVSRSRPVGIELSYDRLARSRRAYESCQCLARVGGYINYLTFNNPVVLGQTVGAGAYFEPLLVRKPTTTISARSTFGVSYLTRVYDPVTNPINTFFSLPVSAWLGLGVQVGQQIGPHWGLNMAFNYNHISNGGTRQPNRGMNFPTVLVGLSYRPRPAPLPDTRGWSAALVRFRWVGSVLIGGSVRVLPQTDLFAEKAALVYTLTALGGYRLNRFHGLSVGAEYTDDGFVRGQLQRENSPQNPRQLGALIGYELRQGRYQFRAHIGINIVHPGEPFTQRIFQRYQLLYGWASGLTVGVSLKSQLAVAQGFDVRAGWCF
jgi:hypothetical protein